MQLPIRGHPLHTRSLTLVVTHEADGRWHARGDVIDLRKVGFVPMMSDIQPAGIIHAMGIDLRIDPAARMIEEVAVEQPVVALEASGASRGECCRDPAPRLQAMQGETLDPDFLRRLSLAFGGALGCSHLLTLFQMMASALERALAQEASLPGGLREQRVAGERLYRRAVFLDGHETDDDVIELALQQSDFHTLPAAVVSGPFDRLAGEWDVRAFARVGSDMKLADVHAAERYRTHETLGSARFADRTERVEALSGGLIIPGLARRLFGLLSEAPEDGLLLEAMLQLAPGHIQVMAAVMDRWFARNASEVGAAGAGGEPRAQKPAGLPEVGNIGGMPDSCYMWRSGGALAGRGFGRGVRGALDDAGSEEQEN